MMDRAYFLLKDTHWTFLWWTLSSETQTRLFTSSSISSRAYWLRIHDVTDIIFDGANSHYSFDVETFESSDHWYIHLPYAGRVYCAEAGYLSDARQFIPGVRSNPLWMPCDKPFPGDSDPRWSRIELD